jgi:hypothetical protein
MKKEGMSAPSDDREGGWVIDEPWCTKNTPSQTNMLFLSGIKYIPSGQCPGYLSEAYSWDTVVYAINAGFSFAVSPDPVAVTVVADRAVLGVVGDVVLLTEDRVGVRAVDDNGREDRGGVDGGSLYCVYPYIEEIEKVKSHGEPRSTPPEYGRRTGGSFL